MSIFSRAFKQTFHDQRWGIPVVIGAISSIVTIAAFIQQNDYSIKWWVALLIVIGAIVAWELTVFLWYVCKNAYARIHDLHVESVWGDIVVVLADVYAMIHQLERKDGVTDSDIAKVLGEFCNKVKTVFDKKTKSNCCVSIKVPISNYSSSGQWLNIVVKNIARDQAHISERDTQEYKEASHDISGNTAYVHILSLVIKQSSKKHYYLQNDVHSDTNYDTTSKRDVIPYKSEMVVPILPTLYKKLDEVSFGGFLCIDSNKKDAFDANRYDIPMTIGLADGLYALMQKLITIQNNGPKHE